MPSPVSLRTFSVVGALLALAALSPADAQTERRTLSGDRVSIYNLAGKLRVQAGSGSQVGVEVTRGGHDAAQLKVLTGEIRGAQSLRVVYPSDRIVYSGTDRRTRTQLRVNSDGTFDDKENGSSFFGRDRVEIRDSGSGLEAHADLVVSVPKGQRISIHWGVGDATVSNVDGDIRVSVAAATLSAEQTRGHLSLDAGSGSVAVTDAQGDVSLDTGSGSVTVNGVRGESLEIDTGSGTLRASNIDVRTLKADVGSGGLRLDAVKASRVSLDAGSGGVDVDLVSRVDDLSVDAGSGGVTIRLPASQGAELSIETGSGGVDSDFAVQTRRIDRNSVHGQIGDGRGRIKIEAGSGRVRLIKGP